LELKEDSGEFVYAILKSQKGSQINPYELKVVSANVARLRNSYYIITASSVTKVSPSRNMLIFYS